MTGQTKKKIRTSLLLLLVATAVGYLVPVSIFAERSHAQAFVSGQLDDKAYYDSVNMQAFYEARGMKPIWVRGFSAFQPRVSAVLAILEESWTHGLNPSQYRVDEIRAMAQNINSENRLTLDFAMSDAVIRYARDLTGMRGQGRSADRMLTYWREPLDTAKILEMAATSANPVEKLRGLEPAHNLYQALRAELMRLVAEAPETDAKPLAVKGAIRPGKTHASIPAIRARMGLPSAEAKETVYDEALAVRVMTLQRSNGITPDGVIAGRTLEIISMTNEAKIWQIMANMERLRWIEAGRPDKYILVNIPSATLWAVEEGAVKLEMPVIIGKTARPTYSFKTEITGVRFNPNWTVPPTIKSQDFLPALREDPTTLARKGIRVFHQGRELDSTQVDWNTVSRKDLGRLRMVQSPGDDNPLGKVRVIMENPYNIYLHDTNHREMFDKGERALSSGCVRVSQPEKLADFILSANAEWTWERMEKMIDSGRMRDISAETKMPVYITYQTVWLDSDGRLVYGRDVYGQDAKLAEILKKAGAVHLPQAAVKSEISL